MWTAACGVRKANWAGMPGGGAMLKTGTVRSPPPPLSSSSATPAWATVAQVAAEKASAVQRG